MNNDLIKRGLAISYAVSGRVITIGGERWIRTSEVRESLNDVPAVEQEVKLVPMAKVTFDEEKLREILHKEVIDKIKSGELVLQAEDKWIPVSERLPGEFQRILVTIVNYRGEKVVRVAEYYHRGKGVFQIKENREQWEVGEKGLLAWMPLPEPYKKEGAEG